MKTFVFFSVLGIILTMFGSVAVGQTQCECSVTCQAPYHCTASGPCPCTCRCDGNTPYCSCGSSGGGKIVPHQS